MFSFVRKTYSTEATVGNTGGWTKQRNEDEEEESTKTDLGQVDDEISTSSHTSDLTSDTTPKANPAPDVCLNQIPSFSLHTYGDDDSEDDSDDMPPPSFLGSNSAQRVSAPSTFRKPLLPNTKSNGLVKTAPSQLMSPPQGLPQRTVPSISAGSRFSSSGPLPNRGPPDGGRSLLSSGGLGVPPGIANKIPNARQKVVLSPGHSPLDWAKLQKSNTNLSGVDRLVRVTPSMLKQQNGRKGKPAWSAYHGKVYNISPYLPFHPGGEGELRRAAGKNGEKFFMDVHPWVNWENMLGQCMVGIMVTEHDGTASKLDEMD